MRGFALALLLSLPGPAHAACRDQTWRDAAYTVCEVTQGADVRVFQTAVDGEPYRSFTRVNEALAPGNTLGFAMNAGMYHDDRSPVGLLIEDGTRRAPLVTADGPGNFGLLPNGVFCIGDRFTVTESRRFKKASADCRHASQSGPMLVIDGALHPRFLPKSASRYIRNGVGVSADGTQAFFVISTSPVNFTEFGSFFRDALHTPQALYFDGNISRLYAPELGRDDFGFPMGPIVGLVVPAG